MARHSNALRARATIIAALAIGISGSAAVAQDTGPGPWQPRRPVVNPAPEIVIVTPPSYGPMRSSIGAPIQDVSLSAAVWTGDLNLQSPADMIELRDRVWDTARRLCARLRFQHPIGMPDEFRCRRNAIANAFDQVDFAIQNYNSAAGIENP